MSEDLIRYDILTQEALRAMIAKLLADITRTGLPGEHHFFITFDTCAPNVQLSSRMKEKYPDEMTIVIQYRYWDLEVKGDRFQIGLSFDEIPELLVIPFAAIKGFYDPSVKFGLQFEIAVGEEFPEPEALPTTNAARESIRVIEKPKKKRKTGKKQKAKPKLFEDEQFASSKGSPTRSSDTPASAKSKRKNENSDEVAGADVVSLDSFRKKK